MRAAIFAIFLIFVVGCVSDGPTQSQKEQICAEAAEQSNLCVSCVPFDSELHTDEDINVQPVCTCNCLDESGNPISLDIYVPSEVFDRK